MPIHIFNEDEHTMHFNGNAKQGNNKRNCNLAIAGSISDGQMGH